MNIEAEYPGISRNNPVRFSRVALRDYATAHGMNDQGAGRALLYVPLESTHGASQH